MLVTGILAASYVGAFTRMSDFFLQGEARKAIVISKKGRLSEMHESVGYVAFVHVWEFRPFQGSGMVAKR